MSLFNVSQNLQQYKLDQLWFLKSGTDKKAAYAAICDADQKNAL